ncbi:MAG: hypothetical protein IPJ47_16370 [Anaerolineales bacterium]|nr:hypothetical protein [Anaerolineales bacterium]
MQSKIQGALVLPEYFLDIVLLMVIRIAQNMYLKYKELPESQYKVFLEPVNPVSFRTPINQRYNSELNGEIRFRLNPNTHASTLMSSDPQTVIEEIQKIYASNPNMFVPGATIYTKAPDFFMVDNGDSYLNDYGGAFGHAAMLVELGSNGPIIHEMSGPNSYIQSNGVYPGTWGNWTYRWEPIKDLEYKIIPRGLFDTVPDFDNCHRHPLVQLQQP